MKDKQRTFFVTCPCCGHQMENSKLGLNSYGEFVCDNCKKAFWVKTSPNGVKANFLTPISNQNSNTQTIK